MNTHQLIINRTGIKNFDSFNNEGYSARAVLLCPPLSKFKINLVEHSKTKYSKEIDLKENDAFTYYLYQKTDNDASSVYAEIVVNEEVCNELCLTEQEQLAAIAHEVGHIILYFREDKETLTESEKEILSDKYACKMGLSKPLHSLLQKLIDSHICSKMQETLFQIRLLYINL